MNESINLIALIFEASLLVQIVMGILLLASLLCWIMIFRLSSRLGSAQKHDRQFEEWFWSGDNLVKLYQGLHNVPNRHGLAQIFYNGYAEFIKMLKNHKKKSDVIDGVERKLRVGLGRQQQTLESGLALLASIGSVAPYIGLFGTVWGIMNAFMGLSQADQVSLAAVAPGIAEALIATAMGLFAAIPAVLAYNHFTAKINRIYDSRALFCEEMTGILLRDVLHDNRSDKLKPSQTTSSQAKPSQVNPTPATSTQFNNMANHSATKVAPTANQQHIQTSSNATLKQSSSASIEDIIGDVKTM